MKSKCKYCSSRQEFYITIETAIHTRDCLHTSDFRCRCLSVIAPREKTCKQSNTTNKNIQQTNEYNKQIRQTNI